MVKADSKTKPRLITFRGDEETVITNWWLWLHHERQRGECARLKRCGTVQMILSNKSFLLLLQKLPSDYEKYHLEAAAVVAGILSNVKYPSPQTLAMLLGNTTKRGDRPVFSGLRFQRLISSESLDELFGSLRRAVIQTDRTANPVQLADTIFHWSRQQQNPDNYQGQRQWRYLWSNDYFKAQKESK